MRKPDARRKAHAHKQRENLRRIAGAGDAGAAQKKPPAPHQFAGYIPLCLRFNLAPRLIGNGTRVPPRLERLFAVAISLRDFLVKEAGWNI